MPNIITKIALDEDRSDANRPSVDIGGELYGLNGVADFNIKEYARLMRLKEFVDTLDLETLSAENAEHLDRVLDEAMDLLFFDKVPPEILNRLRDVQKLSILEAFTDASRDSSEPTISTTRSRASRRSTASARKSG